MCIVYRLFFLRLEKAKNNFPFLTKCCHIYHLNKLKQ